MQLYNANINYFVVYISNACVKIYNFAEFRSMENRRIEYDKSWIQLDRRTIEYEKGMEAFLDIAFSYPKVKDRINCPY